MVQRILRAGSGIVAGENDEDEDERIEPCVPQRDLLVPS